MFRKFERIPNVSLLNTPLALLSDRKLILITTKTTTTIIIITILTITSRCEGGDDDNDDDDGGDDDDDDDDDRATIDPDFERALVKLSVALPATGARKLECTCINRERALQLDARYSANLALSLFILVGSVSIYVLRSKCLKL